MTFLGIIEHPVYVIIYEIHKRDFTPLIFTNKAIDK